MSYFPLVDEPLLDDDPGRDPQETAFLRGIVEDPDDDAARLVFADWLDDHGDADKAAFVRAEVELSRQPQSSECFDRLRDELFRLDDAIGGRWAWALVRPGRLLNCGDSGSKDPVLRFAYQCPNRWADLTPTPQADRRYCGECRKDVHFCHSKQEAEEHAVQGHCVAIGSRLALAIRQEYAGAPPTNEKNAGVRELEFDAGYTGTVGIVSLPMAPPSPYQLWAEELFARQRKRWWQFWK
jgi:uncharacterized protein (TIGR02996 family)